MKVWCYRITHANDPAYGWVLVASDSRKEADSIMRENIPIEWIYDGLEAELTLPTPPNRLIATLVPY